jgi:predicted RecA/RadA family phage recombinase
VPALDEKRLVAMKNFIQDGNVLTLTSPAVTGCKSGDLIIVGAIAGVAAYDAAAGAEVEVAVVGVFELAKASGQLTEGSLVSWDTGAHEVVTPGAGKYPIGVAVAEAGTNDATVRVRLNGTPTAAAGT